MLIRVYTTQFGISIRKKTLLFNIEYIYIYIYICKRPSTLQLQRVIGFKRSIYFAVCIVLYTLLNSTIYVMFVFFNACVLRSALSERILATNVLYAFHMFDTVFDVWRYTHSTAPYVFTVFRVMSKSIHR